MLLIFPMLAASDPIRMWEVAASLSFSHALQDHNLQTIELLSALGRLFLANLRIPSQHKLLEQTASPNTKIKKPAFSLVSRLAVSQLLMLHWFQILCSEARFLTQHAIYRQPNPRYR
ncbi:hypothetical protein AA313_de0207413 [Arthrobotrys entomopaga]|nr:hypothetical protein AA313_de0207413 [Arthrobotrys entomopaga]